MTCCLRSQNTLVRDFNHSSEGCSNTKIGYRWYFIPRNGWGGKYGTTVIPFPSFITVLRGEATISFTIQCNFVRKLSFSTSGTSTHQFLLSNKTIYQGQA